MSFLSESMYFWHGMAWHGDNKVFLETDNSCKKNYTYRVLAYFYYFPTCLFDKRNQQLLSDHTMPHKFVD